MIINYNDVNCTKYHVRTCIRDRGYMWTRRVSSCGCVRARGYVGYVGEDMWTKGEGMWVRARICVRGVEGLHVRVRACGRTECGHAREGEGIRRACR